MTPVFLGKAVIRRFLDNKISIITRTTKNGVIDGKKEAGTGKYRTETTAPF